MGVYFKKKKKGECGKGRMAFEISIEDIWRGEGWVGDGGEGVIDRLLGGRGALPSAIYCNLTSMGKKMTEALS